MGKELLVAGLWPSRWHLKTEIWAISDSIVNVPRLSSKQNEHQYVDQACLIVFQKLYVYLRQESCWRWRRKNNFLEVGRVNLKKSNNLHTGFLGNKNVMHFFMRHTFYGGSVSDFFLCIFSFYFPVLLCYSFFPFSIIASCRTKLLGSIHCLNKCLLIKCSQMRLQANKNRLLLIWGSILNDDR